MSMYDIIIIGAGTAGLSAAIYATRSGNKVLVIEKAIQGGQILYTPDIENYPGIPKISGFEFVDSIYKQAKALGAEIITDTIRSFDFSGRYKQLTSDKNTYQAKAIILATGASHRKLACKGEAELTGRGISYCATCDGAFYRQKDVCVIGGGNTALEDALYLSNNCSTVYLVHRRGEFRGNTVNIQAVLHRDNIKILYHSTVDRINGDGKVSSISIRNELSNEVSELPISGAFIAIGLDPNNELFSDTIMLDEGGYVVADESCTTNIDGVFVAGDARTKAVRQLITAAADGAVSATEASLYINGLAQ